MPDGESKPAQDGLISGALNVLKWFAAEPQLRLLGCEGPTPDNLLNFLRGPFATTTVDEFVERYRRASTVDGQLFVLPTNDYLYRRLIVPLHNAKASFTLGHFLSCIALCGSLAEVMSVLRFTAARVRCGSGHLDKRRQRDLWGRPFERLFQSQRISALHALELIDDRTRDLLGAVATKRNKYVHVDEDLEQSEEQDAFEIYRDLCELLVAMLSLGIDGTKVRLHPDIIWYLQQATRDPT